MGALGFHCGGTMKLARTTPTLPYECHKTNRPWYGILSRLCAPLQVCHDRVSISASNALCSCNPFFVSSESRWIAVVDPRALLQV